jgi:glycolate oxidase iron-sulfur subunit
MEADSPRGRIRQILLVDQGRLELGSSFATHIDRCLDCRACETACPSGVPYGKLVESARAQIEERYPRGFFSWVARSLFYRQLLPHPKRIAAAGLALKLYQRSGLQWLARRSGLLRLLKLEGRERLLPRMDDAFFFSRIGRVYPARGERRARVAFFAGCIANVAFARLNEATLRVLQANGVEVVVPPGQRCCGALAVHAGERDVARRLAATNLQVFLRGEFDAIVTNAAGCGSMLKEYGELFSGQDAPSAGPDEDAHRAARLRERALAFQSKVKDVTEFLAALGLSAPMSEVPLRVTYQDSCHLLHGQRVREAPRRLIRAVPGVELVEMPLADHCCGSAGVYNVTQHAASMALLEEKMRHAAATKAAAIVTANPGCMVQLRAGAEIHGTGQQVLHVVELLNRAIKNK